MSKRRKMSMIIFMIMMVGIFILSTKVEAALQANGGTPITANLNNWISAVRQMQATGGTLGLTDTINNNLTSSNKNMDIHMQKNTEYGAMAILSASPYGNPNKIANGQTTTGNASGIVMELNKEWVAAGPSSTLVANMKGAAGRYWNNYGTGNGNNSKIGDAMAETAGWHGSTMSRYLVHSCSSSANSLFGDSGFVRSCGGSIFSFDGWGYAFANPAQESEGWACPHHNPSQPGNRYYASGGKKDGFYEALHPAKCCVVVGSGV